MTESMGSEFSDLDAQRVIFVLFPLVQHHRRSGNDSERANPGKLANQLFCHAVSEILLLGIAGMFVSGRTAREWI
jgi:hypothetical protein